MFRTIVTREFIDHVTSFRFFAMFALTLLLMLTSVVVFSAKHGQAIKEYRRWPSHLVDEDGKTFLQMVKFSSGQIRRAPLPLAFCSGTAERELPNQALMTAHGLQRVQRTSEIGEMLDSAAHLDWAFVVSVLLSFAAGLLTYKAISGELRDGTLTLVLSNPLSKATLLLAKYLAALLALTIAFSIAVILSLLVIQVWGTIHLTGDDWLKIVLFFLASLLYLSVFAWIGLLCSIFARSPVISAVAFLFNWAFLVFVIPNLGGTLAKLIGKVNTPRQISEMAESIPDKYPLKANMSPDDYASVLLQRDRARERLVIEYVQLLAQQVLLGQDMTRISPTSAFSYAAENIVGSGTPRLARFLDNLVRFREGFLNAVIEADKQDPESLHRYVPWTSGGKDFSYRHVDLGPAKEFHDAHPSGAEGLAAAFWDLLLLMLYNLLAFAVAFWRFARQEVAPAPGA